MKKNGRLTPPAKKYVLQFVRNLPNPPSERHRVRGLAGRGGEEHVQLFRAVPLLARHRHPRRRRPHPLLYITQVRLVGQRSAAHLNHFRVLSQLHFRSPSFWDTQELSQFVCMAWRLWRHCLLCFVFPLDNGAIWYLVPQR